MDLSQRIQALRKENNLSQEQLVSAIGVSRQVISKWESKQSLPELENIIALSDYFNVETDYLLKGIKRDNKTNNPVLTIVATTLLTLGLIAIYLFFLYIL